MSNDQNTPALTTNTVPETPTPATPVKAPDGVSAMDRAIRAAQARKAAKEGKAPEGVKVTKVPEGKSGKAPNPKSAGAKSGAPAKVSEKDRAAAQAKILADREARKAAKAAESAQKRAAALAARKPAHMSKVLKAGEKLPALTPDAQEAFQLLTSSLSTVALASLALHIGHFCRVSATAASASVTLKENMTVRITGGDPRYIGMIGTVDSVRRIRCFIDVPEVTEKLVYCFIADVEPCEEPEALLDSSEDTGDEPAPESAPTSLEDTATAEAGADAPEQESTGTEG